MDPSALALTVGSGLFAALAARNQNRVLSQQRDDIQRGQAAVGAQQHRADGRVRDVVNSLAAPAEPIAEQNLPAYTAAIRSTRGANNASMPTGLGGDRYQAGVNTANQQGLSYADKVAGLVSRIEAPQYQRTGERQKFNRAAVDIGGITDEAETAMYLAQLQARRRRPNPLVAMLAKMGQTFTQNYAGPPESETPAWHGYADPPQESGGTRYG